MFTLRKTCGSAPEIYRVYNPLGDVVGEVSTRLGVVSATSPRVDEEAEWAEVYTTGAIEGIHALEEHERDYYLRFALDAIYGWLLRGRYQDAKRTRPPAPDVDYVIEDPRRIEQVIEHIERVRAEQP